MINALRRIRARLGAVARLGNFSRASVGPRSLLAGVALASVAIIPSVQALGETPLTVAELQRTEPVRFEDEILPVLKRNCLACHQKSRAEGGLILETLASIHAGGDSGPAIVPKEGGSSLLLARAMGTDDALMPPEDNTVGASPLTPEQLGLLRLWIDQGAMGSGSSNAELMAWQPLASSIRPIYSLDISPNGQYAAFGRGNRVAIADLSQPAEIAELLDPSVAVGPAADVDLIQSIAFSPDGERIATGGFRTVKIWKKTWTASGSDHPFTNAAGLVAIQADQMAAAWKNASGEVEVWDLAQNSKLAAIKDLGSALTAIAWAGTASRILTGTEAGRVAVWDATTGALLAHHDFASPPGRIAASRDGGSFAVMTQDRQVHYLRFIAATASTPAALEASQASVAGVLDANDVAVLSQPASAVLIASESRGVILADTNTNAVLRTLNDGAPVNALAVTRDETQVVTAGQDGKARLWTVADAKLVRTFEGTPQVHLHLAQATRDVARHQSWLEKLNARSAELDKLLKTENEALAIVNSALEDAIAADAKNQASLAAAAEKLTALQTKLDQLTAIVTPSTETAATVTPELEEAKAAVEASGKELEAHRLVVTAAEEAKRASAAELQKQQLASDATKLAQQRAAEAVPTHQAVLGTANIRLAELEHTLATAQQQLAMDAVEIIAVDIDAGAQQVATLHRDGSKRVFRVSDGQPILIDLPSEATPASKIVSGKGQWYCFAATGGATCWPIQPQWTLERVIGSIDDDQTLSDRITALDFHRDAVTLAVGTGSPSRSGSVKLFSVESGELIRDFGEVHADTVLSLAFSPDGKTLASASSDRTIRLLDQASGSIRGTLEGHTHHVMSVAWQDDGRTLASSSADLTVRVWDSQTGETSRTLTGFPQEVTSVGFVQATRQLVAAGGGGHVRLADASNGQTVRSFQASDDFLFTVGVTPDGTRVLSGGQSGTLRIWKLADAGLEAELK